MNLFPCRGVSPLMKLAGRVPDGDEVREVTCDECQLQMPEYFQSPPEAGPWAEHLQSCSNCAQQWSELRLVLSQAQDWQVAPPPSDLVDRALARITEPRRSWWRALDEALQRFGQRRLSWRSGAFTAVVGVALMSRVLAPHFLRGRSSGAEVACQRSQRVFRQALENYAHDHGGQFPGGLQQLSPRYLHSFPRCPLEKHDSLLEYQVDHDFHHYRLRCPHHPH